MLLGGHCFTEVNLIECWHRRQCKRTEKRREEKRREEKRREETRREENRNEEKRRCGARNKNHLHVEGGHSGAPQSGGAGDRLAKGGWGPSHVSQLEGGHCASLPKWRCWRSPGGGRVGPFIFLFLYLTHTLFIPSPLPLALPCFPPPPLPHPNPPLRGGSSWAFCSGG